MGGNLLDRIPVQLWRLVQTGGGQSGIIIALQGIMNGLLFAGLLCPHLCAAAALTREKNTGREKGGDAAISIYFKSEILKNGKKKGPQSKKQQIGPITCP